MDFPFSFPSVIPFHNPYPIATRYLFTVKISIGKMLNSATFKAQKGRVATIETEKMEKPKIKTKFLLNFKKGYYVVVVCLTHS
jgi:hypothetical protein